MVYGDAMLLSCEGAEEFIPTDFKEKCCNAYGAICSPGKIEAEYPAMFPLAPDYFQFWSGGDGKESAARFQLPAEKGGDRYRTLFSIGCRYPNNQVKSIDVTVSASNYRPNQEDQLTPPPSDPSDESREVPPSRPDDKPSDTFTRSTTTTRASVNREERGSSSGAMPIRFSFSTLVNAVVFFVLYQ
ncbi:sag-related sequence srs67 [Cystoisospora suis]|uniref:Sag-related sequence srs67 n=1 Tax=Cystoisospora suis TaxID=483139 RepID=A0A2C6L2Q3_9APIC|nr:sag-related sequence srs67 [Cystoisospora suis]